MDLFPSNISCAVSKPEHKTKTISKPIPKPANPYQNQYQYRQIHIKIKIQDQNSKTSIGFGAYLSTGNTQSKEGKRSTVSRGSEGIRMLQEVKGIERTTDGKGIQGVERVVGGKGVENFFVR